MLDVTKLLRSYAALRNYQLRKQDPAAIQERVLVDLVSKAKRTKFGIDHSFPYIKTVSDYQKNVPLRTYESFWNDYWSKGYPVLEDSTWPGRIPYFPLSSGTTSGTTKYIPCSNEMIKSNTKAALDLLVHHVTNRPESRIFAGKSFMLGGSTDLKEEMPGVFSGDLSGIAAKVLPFWAKNRFYPPPELALLKDWEEKIERLARGSLEVDIRSISGVPSWLLIFFEKLASIAGKSGASLAELYPNLELLSHGGVNFAPYHSRFLSLLAGSKCELREVYPASEGFIAVADRGYNEGLRLILDNGLFSEFIPFDELSSPSPTRHWIDSIEIGVNYAIVLTTCAGLWSYVLGDTVRFIDKSPPRLLITGRTSYYLSAFGEHLIGEEIESALSASASALGLTVEDYSVGPVYPTQESLLGGHLYVVEFTRNPTSEERELFLQGIDEELCRRNEDYAAHRANGFGLKPPEMLVAAPGAFASWMKARGKLGGQNKVPRIITTVALFDSLLDHVRKGRSETP